MARALQKIDRLAERLPLGFPSGYGNANEYAGTVNTGWTPGFWTGLLWLAWQRTGDRAWRDRADRLIPTFIERLDAGGDGVETHDLGFLYTLSCVAGWKLTGDAGGRAAALRAADLLSARFWPRAGVIQAWARLDDPRERGRIIIDSVMNMPLLFWAAEDTGGTGYREIAVSHLDQCLRLLVREDGSTIHTYFVDTNTGAGRYARTHQGASDDSCWSRGQAWALYGLALAFRHTRESRYRDAARRVAVYFLDHLPADGICCWDLTLDAGSQRDTSAAAIAVCGLLELSTLLEPGDPDGATFNREARRILETLVSTHASRDAGEDGILLHGVCHMPQQQGVNECCLWGDYFYVEALARRDSTWSSFW